MSMGGIAAAGLSDFDYWLVTSYIPEPRSGLGNGVGWCRDMLLKAVLFLSSRKVL